MPDTDESQLDSKSGSKLVNVQMLNSENAWFPRKANLVFSPSDMTGTKIKQKIFLMLFAVLVWTLLLLEGVSRFLLTLQLILILEKLLW